MPDVIVRRKKGYLVESEAPAFFISLQHIVAKALTVPGTGGEITQQDIVVRDFIHSDNDVGTMKMEITVMTEDMPERRANQQERAEQIAKSILSLKGHSIEEGENNVWVILVPSGFKVF